MNQLWSLTIEDYCEILERATKAGVKEGESIEKYILEYVEEKGIKPIRNTELNIEEIKQDYRTLGYKVGTIQDLIDKFWKYFKK